MGISFNLKTKIYFSSFIVVIALFFLMLSLLTGLKLIRRDIDQLTRKTTPYQIKVLNLERLLGAHIANLVEVSNFKTKPEYDAFITRVKGSSQQVERSGAELAALKNGKVLNYQEIKEITLKIMDNTLKKIIADEQARDSLPVIKGKNELSDKSMYVLEKTIRNLQKNSSGTMIGNIDQLMDANKQNQAMVSVRNGLKDLYIYTSRISLTTDEHSCLKLRDSIRNTIISILSSLQELNGKEALVQDLGKRLNKINSRLTSSKGIISQQIKRINDENEMLRDIVDDAAKEVLFEINNCIPLIEKELSKSAELLSTSTSGMTSQVHLFTNTNAVLNYTSSLSLLNKNIEAQINYCYSVIYLKDMEEMLLLIRENFRRAYSIASELTAILVANKQTREAAYLREYINNLKEEDALFMSKEGIADKLEQSIKYRLDLEEMIRKMNEVVSRQLSASKEEADSARKSQESAIVSLNKTADLIIKFVLGIGVFMVLGMILISFFLQRSITLPIVRAMEIMNKSVQQVISAASQLFASSQELARVSSDQSAAIEESTNALNESVSLSEKNVSNISQASELTGNTKQVAEEANREMTELMDHMNEINASSDKISKILKTIDDIAFQTNLLALNAAVEAARAGEAGKGFAVVAEEVRNLAQRSAQAARDTASIIENSIGLSQKGFESTQKVALSLKKINEQTDKVSSFTYETAESIKKQSQGTQEINRAIGDIAKVTQNVSANAVETSSTSEALNKQARELSESVDQLNNLVYGGK
ncbi:MAG: methyl-accepting chemotaxis protein [Candidatus Margulisbacteria bacterium]|nr:methyl-accepting chemotaxis protein [Candidatus Margulisiibacteriota bacterium]